jgi:hypothetical protein
MANKPNEPDRREVICKSSRLLAAGYWERSAATIHSHPGRLALRAGKGLKEGIIGGTS